MHVVYGKVPNKQKIYIQFQTLRQLEMLFIYLRTTNYSKQYNRLTLIKILIDRTSRFDSVRGKKSREY